MNIHHATVKRAEKAGIVLTVEGTTCKAHHTQSNRVIHHDDPKAALALAMLAARFGGEYAKVSVYVEASDDTDFLVIHEDADDALGDYSIEALVDGSLPIDEVFAEVLDKMHEMALSDEAEEDEDKGGQVVPAAYRERYRAEGHPDNCGDWLAGFMTSLFLDASTAEFSAEAFTAFLIENGVDMSGKWASLPQSGQRGWKGRYRMNGRQKLEVVVAKRGTVIHNGKAVKVPADALKALRDKHPEKKTKKEA